MESERFDRLTRSIGEASSRRRLLATAAATALSVVGLHGGEAAAGKKKKGRTRCNIEAGRGVCVHDMCAISCKNPGKCKGGKLPQCGPNAFDCGCAKLLNGKTACVVPRSAVDLCAQPACTSNQDCNPGSACVKVPGCCTDRTQVCAFSCQSSM